MSLEDNILELDKRKKTFLSKIRTLSLRKQAIFSVFRKKLEEKKLDEIRKSLTLINKNHNK